MTHSAPTFASRVPARPPSLPARPSVSEGRAGTPVPSSATHRISPSFNGLRTGAASGLCAGGAFPPSAATEIDPASAVSRRASGSSPTARVARSMPRCLQRAFAP